MTLTAGILGASGYAGAEVLRLLARHPRLDVTWAAGDRSAGQLVAERYPGLAAAYGDLTLCTMDEGLDKGADVLFLALPHGEAAALAAGGWERAASLVVDLSADSKSGLTGAGRSLKDPYLYAQANESVTPYGVGTHRHTPEIEQELARAAGRGVAVTFTPHLVPMSRGILATCYATLAGSADDREVAACHARAYAGEPFVDVLRPGAWPATRAVASTNRVQVAAATDRRTGRVVAAAAIDNLVKGAAGQAVQCANVALGLPETAGLDLVPPGP